jgi:hypothetical protein
MVEAPGVEAALGVSLIFVKTVPNPRQYWRFFAFDPNEELYVICEIFLCGIVRKIAKNKKER